MIFKTQPWGHQVDCYNFAYNLHGAGIFLDMGAGKTKVAIDLIVNRGHQKILTVCPYRVIDVWPKQVDIHSDGINVITLKKGTLKERAEVIKSYQGPYPIMFVINYEAVWQEPVKSVLKKAGFDIIILDEAHRIKKPGGKASMHMHTLGKITPWRLALTGTPLPNSPIDAYALYRFIDQSVFGTRLDAFEERYVVENKFSHKKKFINQEELSEKMYSVAFRVLTRDVLDLPEPVEVTRTFEMCKSAMDVYKILEKESVLMCNDKAVAVNNVLAQYVRLHKMTSGYMPDGFGGEVQIDDNKRELFADILQDLAVDEPIVVFARFINDLDNIKSVCRAQKRKYVEVSGRADDLRKWQDDKADVVGVQIQSGAEGEDYTRSHYAIYYSLGFSLKDYEQSRRRIDRPGQELSPVFIHLLAENTVDELIMQSIREKKDIVDFVNDHYRKGG